MSEVLALGPGALSAMVLAVLVGTVIQRLSGQGLGMIAAPVVAIFAPSFLPAAVLILGLFVGLTSSAFDPKAIRWAELPAGFAGRVIGAVIAVSIASWISDPDTLALIVAMVIFTGIGLSLIGIRVPIRPATLFPAGILGGVMGTLTAVGAAPMALLYQYEPQRQSAAMQNVYFFWGMIVSIPALWLAGLMEARHFALAALLLPPAALSLWVAQRLAGRVERARIRPWALSLSGIAATTLVVRLML